MKENKYNADAILSVLIRHCNSMLSGLCICPLRNGSTFQDYLRLGSMDNEGNQSCFFLISCSMMKI